MKPSVAEINEVIEHLRSVLKIVRMRTSVRPKFIALHSHVYSTAVVDFPGLDVPKRWSSINKMCKECLKVPVVFAAIAEDVSVSVRL